MYLKHRQKAKYINVYTPGSAAGIAPGNILKRFQGDWKGNTVCRSVPVTLHMTRQRVSLSKVYNIYGMRVKCKIKDTQTEIW